MARLLAAADVTGSVEMALGRLGWLTAAAVGAAGMIAGADGALVAVAVMPAGAYAWAKRRASLRLARIGDAFPDACRAMADALRAGMNLPQAIEMVATDCDGPLAAEMSRVATETRLGVPMHRAFARFAERCPVPGAELLAAACAVTARTGANLAPILDGVVASARDRARLDREMRAATAQGRMTAAVVAALPFAFLLLIGAGSNGEIHLLLREPAGWVLLAVGVSLQSAGAFWIRRMVRRP